MDIYSLVFDDYETLDLMGSVEFLSRVPNGKLHYVSQVGGLIRSKQGFYIETEKLEHLLPHSVLLVVGGQGTRQLVNDEQFINQLGKWIDESEICLSVCTGSALLACTGRLDSLKVTSNKKSFEWVKQCRPPSCKMATRCKMGERWQVLHFIRRFCWYGYGAWVYC